MKKPTLGRKTARHPAVIDLPGGSPTAGNPPGARTAAPGGPATPPPPRPPTSFSTRRRGPTKKAAAVTGAAAVALAGAMAISHLPGDDSEATQAAATITAATTADENGLPILDLPDPEPTEQPVASDRECRADRGDQKSAAGVIAAFNHAYYRQRNGDAARALATPTSSVLPGPELQKVIDAVPVGTNYCLRTIELSVGVYLADLSVMQPAQLVKRGTQTITTVKIDGRWYVDIFT
ncbi:hypothetical protein ACFVKB_34435 [Rhodococcus sp. NPDC127530]|uniref:hypothetical protein n=1 Tax=unclassified Rhodococcus (in: high G+C Gram-positive bacteria) TaxID=192944 RepID=UPI00362BA13D